MNSPVRDQEPEIGIIIVNYNSGDKLLLCLRSLFALRSRIKVVIVDNASSDHSLDLFSAAFLDDARLQIVRNEKNLGFAVACNIGAEQLQSEYLLYLNPDCRIEVNTISRLIDSFSTVNEAGMAGGLILNEDGTEQVGGRRSIPTPWRTLVRIFHLSFLKHRYPRLFSDFNLHQQPLPNHPVEVEAISGACMLVSREAYTDVGGLDEGYFLHCEDLDWCMTFRQKGWKVIFVPDARISHVQGVCSRNRPVFVEWNKHKGMLRFYGKFFRHQYPGILMWLVTIAVWLRFCLLACSFLVRRFLKWVHQQTGPFRSQISPSVANRRR